MDISNLFQPCGKSICLIESRKQDQAVHLPGFSAFFIDGTDLTGQYKPGCFSRIACRLRQNIFLFQPEQSLFRRDQLRLQLLPPDGMCHISGSKECDPFFPRPKIQHLRRAIFAGCHGISGMYVQVCDLFQNFSSCIIFSSVHMYILSFLTKTQTKK